MWIPWLIQPQMLQDLLNNIRILYRCNDPDGPTTLLAFLNLDGEHTLKLMMKAPARRLHRSAGLKG